jgi:hypothetical protein
MKCGDDSPELINEGENNRLQSMKVLLKREVMD